MYQIKHNLYYSRQYFYKCPLQMQAFFYIIWQKKSNIIGHMFEMIMQEIFMNLSEKPKCIKDITGNKYYFLY